MHEGGDNKAVAAGEGCRVFDRELAAYLEGEERPGLVAHTRECPFCYSLLADLQAMRSAGSELALEEPPARLWAKIRASLIAEGIIRVRQAWWRRWLAGLSAWVGQHNPVAVATLGCLLVLGVGLVKVPSLLKSARPTAPAAPPAAVNLSDITGVAAAVGPMEKSYQARAVSLEPLVKATYQKSLDSLDGEIRECLDSVKQQPDNLLAREYLLAAYEQKAHVLQSALEFDRR